MGRDTTHKDEFNKDIFQKASELLEKVNAMLDELGIKSAKVSSGWRPPSINSATAKAATKSAHMTGEAVDLFDDKDQSLCKLILSKPELLKKYGLWMEDMGSTKGKFSNWCHLDTRKRSDRPVQVFKP